MAPFVAYVSAFFIVWSTLRVWGVYRWAVRRLGDATLAYALISFSLRLALWVLPVDHANPIEYLQLRRHWKRGLAVGLVLSGLNFMLTVWRLGLPHLHATYLTWNSVLGTSILIGFFEERSLRSDFQSGPLPLFPRFSSWEFICLDGCSSARSVLGARHLYLCSA